MKKLMIFMVLALFSGLIKAGAWSDWAVPSRIDVERGNGVMVWGSFGNSGNCTHSNRVYVPESHPQYDKVYAMALAGFSASKEMKFYIDSCQPVTWYAKKENTFNWTTTTAVNIRQPK